MNMKWWLSFSSHITLLVFAEVIFTHTPHTQRMHRYRRIRGNEKSNLRSLEKANKDNRDKNKIKTPSTLKMLNMMFFKGRMMPGIL